MSILDRCCSCFLGNPPCSFCTDTYECEKCETRVEVADEEENAVAECLCTECYFEREDGDQSSQDADDLMDSIRNFCR